MVKFTRVDNNASNQPRYVNTSTITLLEVVQTATNPDSFVLSVKSPSYNGYVAGGGWSSQEDALHALNNLVPVIGLV